MSKYLTFSLIIVALFVGMVAGFSAAGRTSPAQPMESKLGTEMKKETAMEGAYTDQEFLAEMIAHHEDAIKMAEEVLKHTSRKEVTQMANDIISVQSEEIAQMKAWLMAWQ